MIEVQQLLSSRVEFTEIDPETIEIVAGVDLTYFNQNAICVIASIDLKSNKVLDITYSISEIEFEYEVGLLAFRELPAILETWKKLQINPDLVMFDGHGYIHPRRCGLATHASFFIEKPTIGIAKKPYIGEYALPNLNAGSFEYISDGGEIIGAVVRTKTGVKPIYVSVGNYITLQEAIDYTFLTTGSTQSKIPLPTYIADQEGRKIRTNL
ncbi:MAG: endonuclease V [Candidatus Kariarchaeaceae archaeon]|jgi:deoxyribonuclease V